MMRVLQYLCLVPLLCILFCIGGCSGFGCHADLLVADEPGQSGNLDGTVRITYLGTNGYLLESNDQSILIDPYFTRVGLDRVALNWPIEPDTVRINWGLMQTGAAVRNAKFILITHGHFDHLMDAPEIAQQVSAVIVGSDTVCHLARAAGLPEDQTIPVKVGGQLTLGPITVRAIKVEHDKFMGKVPHPGQLDTTPEQPPSHPCQWVVGTPLGFVIEMSGKRIYIDSGGTTHALPPEDLGPVDLAILGVALPASRDRVAEVIDRLKPRVVLPSHQDDFFVPLSRGFVFALNSKFSDVRCTVETLEDGPQLILLDYFKPWTLR